MSYCPTMKPVTAVFRISTTYTFDVWHDIFFLKFGVYEIP